MRLPPAREGRFYIPALDGIRGVAFLLVFAGHAGLYYVVPGGLGVTIFFFLSGYLITTLLRLEAQQRGTISLRDFYMRRVIRILPPFYITLAIACLLGFCGVMSVVPKASAYLSAITFSLNYYALLPNGPVWAGPGMGVCWSLCIEEHFYLVFPFVYRFFLKRDLSPKTQVKILVAGCLFALVWRTFLVFAFHIETATGTKWTYDATDCRFDSIVWGAILAIRNNAWFKDRGDGLLARSTNWAAVLGCAGLLFSLVYRNPVFRETARYTLQGISLYAIFYYCIATEGSLVVRLLQNRALRWIGTLSYTLYLCHLYILNEFHTRYPHQLVLDAAVSFALALAFAGAMNRIVERPMQRLRASFRQV